MQQNPLKPLIDDKIGFAVVPVTTCTHYNQLQVQALAKHLEKLKSEIFNTSCSQCDCHHENWICLTCQHIACSRYINAHMEIHNLQSNHPVVMSLVDFSFWCYECTYITSDILSELSHIFSMVKFPPENNNNDIDKLTKVFNQFKLSQEPDQGKFSYNQLVDGIKSKKFNKIVVLTGAGISVAAGIPDFRSPDGFYAKLEKEGYNTEDVFNINTFKKDPKIFYSVSKTFISDMLKCKPVKAHYFIKKLSDNQQLLQNFTQNIDGLELQTGLDPNQLMQAHGNVGSAICIECDKIHPIQEMIAHLQSQEIYVCSCGGLIKPNVIFFGEQLPDDFEPKCKLLPQCDLVIVMGTSLKVQPFCLLVHYAEKHVPVVIIDRGIVKSGINEQRVLNLQGNIEEVIEKLEKDIGWNN